LLNTLCNDQRSSQ